jgi:glutaredoxin
VADRRGWCARRATLNLGASPGRVTLVLSAMSVVMYVKPGCPYCQAAREHLAAEEETVEERDATENAVWKAELMSYTNNRGVVPTIIRSGGRDVQVGFPPGRG